MKRRSYAEVFLWYLKDHKKTLILFVLFILIFSAVFSLYSLPMEAVLYAALLSGLSAAVFAAVDFTRYVRRHRILESFREQIALEWEKLPPVRFLFEEDYRGMIETLLEERRTAASLSDARQSEMEDYYTLWAHQIKTPISAMRLLLQAKAQDPSDAELLAELFKIEQYVNMVLGYLRIESSSTDLVLQNCSLSSLIRQAVKSYASVFIRKKITLDFCETDCVVLTDEKWMVFVLEQLLSNALKYTGSGGRIRIFMPDPARKILYIEDTGIGIDETDLPRVFEKGFTGGNGRIDKKATGIGLYLCRKIVRRLSHKIEIESRAGVGTTVKIDFFTDRTRME